MATEPAEEDLRVAGLVPQPAGELGPPREHLVQIDDPLLVHPHVAAVRQGPAVPLAVAIDPVVAIEQILDVDPAREGHQDGQMQPIAVERRDDQAGPENAQHVERQPVENGVDLKSADGPRHHPLLPARSRPIGDRRERGRRAGSSTISQHRALDTRAEPMWPRGKCRRLHPGPQSAKFIGPRGARPCARHGGARPPSRAPRRRRSGVRGRPLASIRASRSAPCRRPPASAAGR